MATPLSASSRSTPTSVAVPRTASSDIASKIVGQEIREVRLALGLSQAVVAERLAVTPGYIASVEAGRYNLTIGQLMNFATALQVELEIKLTVPKEDEAILVAPRYTEATVGV